MLHPSGLWRKALFKRFTTALSNSSSFNKTSYFCISSSMFSSKSYLDCASISSEFIILLTIFLISVLKQTFFFSNLFVPKSSLLVIFKFSTKALIRSPWLSIISDFLFISSILLSLGIICALPKITASGVLISWETPAIHSTLSSSILLCLALYILIETKINKMILKINNTGVISKNVKTLFASYSKVYFHISAFNFPTISNLSSLTI